MREELENGFSLIGDASSLDPTGLDDYTDYDMVRAFIYDWYAYQHRGQKYDVSFKFREATKTEKKKYYDNLNEICGINRKENERTL